MEWRTITKIVCVATAAFLIIYDLFPFFAKESGDTISEVVLYYSLRCFSIPFIFGMLCGHFFVPRDGHEPKPYILIPTWVAIILLDVATYVWNIQILMSLHTHPWVALFIGIPVGIFVWPQTRTDKL
jgi:hypothetical protein